MSALSKRLDKLKMVDEWPSMPLIIANRGESSEDAIIRHGLDPTDASKHYQVIQFVSVEDVRNGLA